MKNAIILAVAAGVAALAGVMAYRLSTDALAMVLGVVLGFMALIPALIIAVVALRRNHELPPPPAQTMSQPPVVVVSGGFPQMLPMGQPQGQQAPFANQAMLPPPPQAAPRQFRVLGYEATDDQQADAWPADGWR